MFFNPRGYILLVSIHLKNDIIKGSRIKRTDLIMLRPGDGISPMNIDEVVGRLVKYSLSKGHKLTKSDII